MANNNTINSQVSGSIQGTLASLTSAVISTTATAFRLNDGAVSGSGGGVKPLSVPDAGSGLYLGTGRIIRLRGTGVIKTIADEDLTITIYQVPSSKLPIANTTAGQTTFTGWNALKNSGSLAIDNASIQESFVFEANLQLSATGQLEGSAGFVVNNQVVAVAAITAVASLAEADLNFAVVVTLGVGTTGTVISMTEFSIEQV